jgi:hypothetical protein
VFCMTFDGRSNRGPPPPGGSPLPEANAGLGKGLDGFAIEGGCYGIGDGGKRPGERLLAVFS